MATASKLGPGLLTFGATGSAKEFGGVTSECYLEPEYDKDDDTPVLDGSEVDGDETVKWTLKFTKFQDYSAESLDLWLFQHQGETMPFTFVPSKEGKLQAKGKVKIRAGKLGGEVKKKNNAELELPAFDVDLKPDYSATPGG